VKGKGGHGSLPELAKDPLPAAVEIYMKHQEIVREYEELAKKRMFVSTLTCFHSGHASNVIDDNAEIQGTLRTFDEKVTFDFKSKFQSACEKICKKHGVQLILKLDTTYPVVINSPEETKIVAMLAKEVYGETNVGDWGLPGPGSEDFSYYTRYLPGVFFFPTSGKKHQDNPFIHETTYDFDDEAIEKASELFYKIVLHQFGVKEPVKQDSARTSRTSSTEISEMGKGSDTENDTCN
jgi:amidohydrolase